MEVFTGPWVDRFREEINRSEDYKTHGATWEAPIALESWCYLDPSREVAAGGKNIENFDRLDTKEEELTVLFCQRHSGEI